MKNINSSHKIPQQRKENLVVFFTAIFVMKLFYIYFILFYFIAVL